MNSNWLALLGRDDDLNVNALLDDYDEKYYGSAAEEMKAFGEYAEKSWMRTTKDADVITRLFELIEAAKTAAGDDVYRQRVRLLSLKK